MDHLGKKQRINKGEVTQNLVQPLSTAEYQRKFAAYARVSTDNEAQQESYEAQVDHYTRFIKSKPEWAFVNVYSDDGVSGTDTRKRDGFNQMIQDALDTGRKCRTWASICAVMTRTHG